MMGRLPQLSAAVLVAILSLTWPSLAQTPPQATLTPACRSHADLTDLLSQKYAEQPSALGVQADGQLVEVFVSSNGASWTIVVTRPDGWSCIVAVGQNWEAVPDPILEPLA